MSAVPFPKKQRYPHQFLDAISVDRSGRYIIKGLLERGSTVLIYGPANCGKSFFAIDLSGHIASGLTWRDCRVKPGLVVYVATEAGQSINRRLAAWRDYKLGESRDDRVPLAVLPSGPNLLSAADTGDLLLKLRELISESRMPLAAVIFDTLSRSIPGGDENSSRDMTAAIGAADAIRDEFDCAVVFVHHSGKDATKGARGHSALFAAADTVLAVDNGCANLEKSRDGQNGEAFGFKLQVVDLGKDDEGDPMTTCVCLPAEVKPAKVQAGRLTAAGRVAIQALKEALQEHGEALPSTSTIPKGVKAVRIDRWRHQFRVRYGSDEEANGSAVRMAFLRGKDSLLKSGMVTISDPYIWIVHED